MRVSAKCQRNVMKSRIFAEKGKTIVHRLTYKAYQFCNSKQFGRQVEPKNNQQKPTSLLGAKNWKRRRKDVGNETLAPLEYSTSLVKSPQLLLSNSLS